MIKNFIYIIIAFIPLFACQKEITLDVEEVDQEVVVEGYIEQNAFPKVYLSLSSSFFSDIDSATLFNMMVHQAKVTVSDGYKTEVLTLRKNTSHYPIYFYEGTELIGQVGRTYHLYIKLDSISLSAVTTIPAPPKFDSLWVGTLNDSMKYISIKFTDKADSRDYYRTFMKVNGQNDQYVPTYINVFDDIYFNGTTVVFNLYKGYDGLADMNNHNKYLSKGDTVVVRFCSMDKYHFDFWNSYQGKMLNIASFSPSLNKVKTNIKGGLGVWGGYGASYYKVIVK